MRMKNQRPVKLPPVGNVKIAAYIGSYYGSDEDEGRPLVKLEITGTPKVVNKKRINRKYAHVKSKIGSFRPNKKDHQNRERNKHARRKDDGSYVSDIISNNTVGTDVKPGLSTFSDPGSYRLQALLPRIFSPEIIPEMV